MKKDLSTTDEFPDQKSTEILNSRRNFIKKAAYTAPTLIALGYLTKPDMIHADGTGGPDGPPLDELLPKLG